MDMNIQITPFHMVSDINYVLRRRGLVPQGMGSPVNTLYPEEKLLEIIQAHGQFTYHEYFPDKHISDYYMECFGKSSFRKMVRLLLADGSRPFVETDRLRDAAGASAAHYLRFLDRLLLLEHNASSVRLNREIDNLGPSLEHYVAELCIRELKGSAGWGVLLENLPRSGGDYDVLAWLEPSLMYVECKTARPSNIEESELREFLQRSFELAPDLAVLLIDTDSDLTSFVNDRINPIIREEFEMKDASYMPIKEHPDYPRVFTGMFRIYVTNSRRTVLAQLRRCLQHYYAHMKPVSGYGGAPESVNFTRTRVRDD